MYYETCCVDTTFDEWKQLMKGARKASYKRLVAKIKKELPELYKELTLEYYNPWENDCKQTKTHSLISRFSAITDVIFV